MRQFKTSVGLAFLIRRAINGQQQVDVFGGEFSHRAAVLPDILANGHADSGAIHLEGHGTVSCGEDAELIEYAIVGQEMLVIAGPDHALMQHHQTVTRLAGLPIGTHSADHHEQMAKTFVLKLTGQFIGLVPRGLAEGAAQSQILNGISGERHFREYRYLSVPSSGLAGIVEHFGGVGVECTDASVNLGECEAKLCHSFLVYSPLTST